MGQNPYRYFLMLIVLSLTLTGCFSATNSPSGNNKFVATGKVTYLGDQGLENVVLHFSNDHGSAKTDEIGHWSKTGLIDAVTIAPTKDGFTFEPTEATVTKSQKVANFEATANEFGILTTKPADGETNVRVKEDPNFGSVIEIVFNSNVSGLSQAVSAINVKPGDKFIGYGLRKDNVVRIHTCGHLAPLETTFTVTIDTTLWDEDGRRLSKPYTFTFTTEADTYPPNPTRIAVLFKGDVADIAWERVCDNPRSNYTSRKPHGYIVYRQDNEDASRKIATVEDLTTGYIDATGNESPLATK